MKRIEHGHLNKPASCPLNRKHGRMLKVSTAVFSSVLALVVMEGVARLAGLAPAVRTIGVSLPDTMYQWSSNPSMGYELRPGAPLVNSQGFRDVERPVAKPPGVRRIILLGDSVLEGDVDKVEELISRRMEALYTDGKTQVLNFGVGGYCTRAEVELLKTKGLQLKPDVVVVVFVENDFDDFNSEAAVLAGHPRPAAVNWAFRHVHIFRLACVKLDLFGYVSDADPVHRNMAAIGSNNVVHGLSQLRKLADQYGFEPRVAIWPTFQDTGVGNRKFADPRQDVLIVEVLAEANRIPTCRLSDYFQSYFNSLGRRINPRLEFTMRGDGMHPTVEGDVIAAKAIKAMLDAPPHSASRPAGGISPDQAAALAAHAGRSYSYVKSLLKYAQMEEEDAPETAIRYLQAALKIEPDNCVAHRGMFRQYMRMGRFSQALQHAQRCVEMRPHDPDAFCDLAAALRSSGQRPSAIDQLEKALAIDPRCFEAQYNLGLILLEENKPSQASGHLEAALSVAPNHPGVRKALQQAKSQLGQ